MNECEICFRRTDSFVVKVRMTPSDYDSFFFSPNWCLKFIPNDSAPIRTKFSFRLNPFNSVKSFRMIRCHSPFSPNDTVPFPVQSEWFRATTRSVWMIPSRIQTDWIPNDSETDFAFTRNHTESFSFRMSPKVASGRWDAGRFTTP